MQDTTSLTIQNISKTFDTVRAVQDVSFEARPGQILGLLGPNGAGKTTTIRMIMGIMQPDTGTIGFSFATSDPVSIRERVGYLPEERGLYGDAKIHDLLVYFAELKGVDRNDAKRRASAWIDRMDLSDWATKKVEKLSKGMQQKVQFIAAILHQPDLVILDEPFSGLDPVHQDVIKAFIAELRDDGMTVLLSSHQMNRVEELCDRIFLIHRGQRVLYGNLAEIKESFGDHVVHMRFDGDGSVLSTLPGVCEFTHSEGCADFVLSQEHAPDAFVRQLPADMTIRALHIDRPPLHDIFVKTIEGRIDETA
ncbi:MAG: ATP-binding cassette domain-containing protein [Candidatus Atribacteria bacterium]|nr:MAG: ATP-binding cassette domain-containing protein [Candidatus Atribacteria bacterium]